MCSTVEYSALVLCPAGSGRSHKSSVGHCLLLLMLGRPRQKGGFHSDYDEDEEEEEEERLLKIEESKMSSDSTA